MVLPAGSDYQLADSQGKVWTLDEKGEVTSVGEKADTKLAQNQEKNNLPKGQPKPENFQVEWDFSQSAFAFDTTDEIPYKALVKGKNDVFQLTINQKDTLKYDFYFQTDKGVKVDSKTEKDGVFEISRKGLFDFADEELWVVAKNAKTEKEEVIGKCVLVHLSEKEVNVALVPITEGLQIDTEKIKAIYAKVGVTLRISTDKIFPVTETIDTKNAFGDLSTYSPHQQEVITQYKSERALKSDVYYVFVGKQEGSQAGYMRLGGQFGFAFLSPALSEREGAKDLARTIAHELGHGIFKLEHPFKKDPSKKGTFRTLMDYAQETGFAHSDWKQINDPKLRIGFFEGQDDGAAYGVNSIPKKWYIRENEKIISFITPSKQVVKLEGVETAFFSFGVGDQVTTDKYKRLFPPGVLVSYTKNGKKYSARYENEMFRGYFYGDEEDNYLHNEGNGSEMAIIRILTNQASKYIRLHKTDLSFLEKGKSSPIWNIITDNIIPGEVMSELSKFEYTQGRVEFGLKPTNMNPKWLTILQKNNITEKEVLQLNNLYVKIYELKILNPYLFDRFTTSFDNWTKKDIQNERSLNLFKNIGTSMDFVTYLASAGTKDLGYFEYLLLNLFKLLKK